MALDDSNIIEGQIEETPNQAVSELTGADMLMNLESMIKSHISGLDKLKEELKQYKELLDDIFKNDPTYQEHSEQAKEASKIKANTKKEILKRPQAADLDNKIKSFRSQIKETQGALSDYLREFQRLSGVNEIEGEDGEVREIVYVATLRRKSKF
ncbi:hypothetical protein HY025_04515 [Candidatus Daviesbacteria bacterium]|nr:hypothetical protein [Candidatus Daviesbacteria bacterium]